MPNFEAKGVIPATLMAFHDDLYIDEAAACAHLREVCATPGLSAVTVNGHASEVHACTFDEQQRILALSVAEVGDRLPVVNGVYADGSLEAARIAAMSQQEGARALLVFPPQSMSMGGQLRPEMALLHFRTIAEATDLPIIVFQYPAAGPNSYPLDTLLAMIDEIPQIVAIKDWSNDAMLHERHIRTLQNLPRPVNVLTTHSSWLMSSLVMGAAGLLSGAGSVIAPMQVELFQAVQAGDLPRAQAINDRIYPMAQAFYRPAFLDMHNRMKTCLNLLGKMPNRVVRPPLAPLPQVEVDSLARAMAEAGIEAERAAA
ncbi:MAG: dihydrodipicolinate synthase family protein [Alphaproteobacteria bacterium]